MTLNTLHSNPEPGTWNAEPPSLLRQGVVVVLLALALAAGANAFGPRRLPWRGEWANYVESLARREGLAVADLAAVRTIHAANSHVLFDARSRKEFAGGRLPGAVSLPWREVDRAFQAVEPLLSGPDQPVLAYCAGADCEEGYLLARWLKLRGYRNVTLFAGGHRAWRRAGLPEERGP